MSGIRHYLSRSKVKDCLDGGEKHGVRYIDETNRYEVNEFIREQWFSTDMVVRGKIVDLTKVEGIVIW